MMTGEEVALALRHRTLDMTYERILQRVSVEDKVTWPLHIFHDSFICAMTHSYVYERILQRASVEDKVLYVYRVYIRMCLISRVRCTLIRHMKNIFMKNVFMSHCIYECVWYRECSALSIWQISAFCNVSLLRIRWHDPSSAMIHMCHDSLVCAMTHSGVPWLIWACHDAFMCAMTHSWLIRMCRDAFITYEWIMARMNESSHIWMSHGTYKWDMARMNESCYIWNTWMTHGTYDSDSILIA